VDVEPLSLYGFKEETREENDFLQVGWTWQSEVPHWVLGREYTVLKPEVDIDRQETDILWESLAEQPEFTARSSNIGFGW
jgi:hypothetical protein